MPPWAPVLLLRDLEQYRSPQHTHEVYHLVEMASSGLVLCTSSNSSSSLGMGFHRMCSKPCSPPVPGFLLPLVCIWLPMHSLPPLTLSESKPGSCGLDYSLRAGVVVCCRAGGGRGAGVGGGGRINAPYGEQERQQDQNVVHLTDSEQFSSAPPFCRMIRMGLSWSGRQRGLAGVGW